jgi:hypothetical protein
MLTKHKIFSNIFIFTPTEKEYYKVHQNGREYDEEGNTLSIFMKMRKKFPLLRTSMSYLMNKEELFFYDPFFKSFRTINKEKTLDESINYYYKTILPMMSAVNNKIKLGNNIDIIEVNEYISNIGLNDLNYSSPIIYS